MTELQALADDKLLERTSLPQCVVVPSLVQKTIHNIATNEPLVGGRFVERQYNMILADDLHQLHNLWPPAYNNLLEKLALQRFDLLDIVDVHVPVRFSLVPDDLFKVLQQRKWKVVDKSGKVQCLYDFSDVCNVFVDGHVVSMWESQRDYEYKQGPLVFTIDDVKKAAVCFKGGYGNRDTTRNIGQNVFFGPRLSARPRHSPDSGKGPLHLLRAYYRAYYTDVQWAPLVQMKCSEMGSEILKIFRHTNQNFNEFVGWETCSRGIYTTGSLLDSRKACFMFANEPHKDTCDIASEPLIQEWFDKVPEGGAVKEKLVDLWKWKKIGLATTCGYNHVGEKPDTYNVLSRFAVLGFTIAMDHQTTHHFYGWAFDHFTAATILENGSNVLTSNRGRIDGKEFVVVGWGKGGGPKQANARVDDFTRVTRSMTPSPKKKAKKG